MQIKVTDESHDYSLYLRYDANAKYLGETPVVYWFDIVDDTELNF